MINDIDFDIVSRNALFLLLALTVQDPQEAAEAILHCWYSACIRPVDWKHVSSLRAIIEDVCHKIAGRAPASLQEDLHIWELFSSLGLQERAMGGVTHILASA